MGEQQRFGLGYDDLLKALTIRQPWASLIVAGIKDVENRTWKTNYRGRLVIHAGRGISKDGMSQFGDILSPWPGGVILGTVDLIDCVRDSTSEFAEPEHWHWVLADPIEFDQPIPVTGKLGLWTTDLVAA